jgi:hypothetical protein
MKIIYKSNIRKNCVKEAEELKPKFEEELTDAPLDDGEGDEGNDQR